MKAKDREFLKFAHSKTCACRQCGLSPAVELHHFGSGGMGMKGSDYLVVRLCRDCHGKARKTTAMKRDGDWETLACYLSDASDLMQEYICELRGSGHVRH